MTGKELIVYILQNDLENEEVFKDGTFIGFISESKFASEMDVGVATVRLWAAMGFINHIEIGDTIYIPANERDKLNGIINYGKE